MKYTLRLPTDQYAYIEQEVDADTPEEAVDAYRALQEAWKPTQDGTGLSQKEFCSFVDSYMTTGHAGELETWEKMNPRQKDITNELKKMLVRLNKKNNQN